MCSWYWSQKVGNALVPKRRNLTFLSTKLKFQNTSEFGGFNRMGVTRCNETSGKEGRLREKILIFKGFINATS